MTRQASQPFLFGSSVPRESVDSGISRQILGFDDRIMLVRVWFDVGAIGTLHRHMHSQTTYVESGEFEFTVGQQTRRVQAGDCVYIAPDTQHGAKCLHAGVLIDVFSPMRDDFFEGEST